MKKHDFSQINSVICKLIGKEAKNLDKVASDKIAVKKK